MNWADVRQLHLEISAQCNAVCPQCARYPTASYYEHPNIQSTDVWTVEQVQQRLPREDLINIEEYLLNGTVGDFITNRDALEIVQYLSSASPNARFIINTNGSARNEKWWQELAQIPNLRVNFALDGLADTHHLYRRQTSWERILENAKSFIHAGGVADWTMTIFAHNEHQIDACRELAHASGFTKFYARHSDRTVVPARDRQGNTTHWLLPATNSPMPSLRKTSELVMINKEANYRAGKINSRNEHNSISLPSLDNCDSLKRRSIYIGGNWSVAPCCFLGILSFTQSGDHRYQNFLDALTAAGLTEKDLLAEQQTVREIVDRGFAWIYDRITTDRALTGCYYHCHPDKSNYRIGQATKLAS
jgi:MoaA/NifB/PqqE/SkfB family radical SAM enzyme